MRAPTSDVSLVPPNRVGPACAAAMLCVFFLPGCARPSADLVVPLSVELVSWYVVDAAGIVTRTSPVVDLRNGTTVLDLDAPDDVVFVGYAAELVPAFDAAAPSDRTETLRVARRCDHRLPVTWAQRFDGDMPSSPSVFTVSWLAAGCDQAGAWPESLCGLAPECAESPCEGVTARVERFEGLRLEARGVLDAVIEPSGTTLVALSGQSALARLEGSRVTLTATLAGLGPLTSIAQSDGVAFVADRAGAVAMLDEAGRLSSRAVLGASVRVLSRGGRTLVYGPTVAPRLVTTTTLSIVAGLPAGVLALDHDGADRLAYLTLSGAVVLAEPGVPPRVVGKVDLPLTREHPPTIALTREGLVVGDQLDVRQYWAAEDVWRTRAWVERGAGLEVLHLEEAGGFVWGLGNGGLLFRYTAWRRCRVPLGVTAPLTALVLRDGGEYEVFGGGLARASFDSPEPRR